MKRPQSHHDDHRIHAFRRLRNWQLAHEHPYILGEFVWTAMDYLGESGIGSTSNLSRNRRR